MSYRAEYTAENTVEMFEINDGVKNVIRTFHPSDSYTEEETKAWADNLISMITQE